MELEGVEGQCKSLESGICRVLIVELKAASRTSHYYVFFQASTQMQAARRLPHIGMHDCCINLQVQLLAIDMFA